MGLERTQNRKIAEGTEKGQRFARAYVSKILNYSHACNFITCECSKKSWPLTRNKKNMQRCETGGYSVAVLVKKVMTLASVQPFFIRRVGICSK